MNRKLRKALREIYASEQPEHLDEFLNQLPAQKKSNYLHIAAPAVAVLALGAIGSYGYINAKNAYHPYQDTEQQAPEEILMQMPETETFTTTAEIIEAMPYTGTVPVTTAPEETEPLPETVIEIFPPMETIISSTTNQTTMQTTATETTTEEIITTAPPEPETEPEIINTEPETEPLPETEPFIQIHWPEQTITETIPETTFTETQTETTKNVFYSCIEDMTLSAKIDEMQFEYFTLRHNEVLDWTMNGLYYADEWEIADKMLSDQEEIYQQNENPFYEHYRQVIAEINETNFGQPEDRYVGSTAQWTILGTAYQNLLDEEVIQIEQYLTEHDALTELENFRESQEHFRQEYENFWNADDFYYEYSSPHTDYINAVLLQGRVVFLMNYFEYFEYFE